MNVFGADIGFRNFKGTVLDRGLSFVFTNVIGHPTPLEIAQDKRWPRLEDDLSICWESQVYYVGNKAIRQSSNHRYTFLANKIDKVDETIKLLAGLGLLYEKGISEIDLLVTSVPVEEYHLVKEQIQQQFRRSYSYVFRDKAITSKILDVEVIPQGAGDYYDYILSKENNLIDSRVMPKTLIINIGYRTTEIVVMNYGKFSRSESTTLYTAMNSIHKELKRLLVREYGVTKNLTEIDQIWLTGKVYIDGVEHDITRLKEQATAPHIAAILGEVPVWVNKNDLHNVIIAGGDAKGFKPYVEWDFECPVICGSQMGNARGSEKYGRLKLNA